MDLSVYLLIIFSSIHITKQAENQTELPKINETNILSSIHNSEIKQLNSYMEDGTLLRFIENRYQNQSTKWKIMSSLRDKLQTLRLLMKAHVVSAPTNDDVKQNLKGQLFNMSFIPGIESTFVVNPRHLHNISEISELNGLEVTAFQLICLLDGIQPRTVKYVLDQYGGDVNLKTSNNLTALFSAAYKGNLQVVKFLVENGATMDDVFFAQPSIIYRRSEYDFTKLLSKQKIKIQFETMRLKITPLFTAAIEFHTEVVRYLLEKGADPNAEGQGWLAMISPVMSGDKDLLELLLQHGSDVSSREAVLGQTMVHKAASFGQIDVLKLLLKYHANLHATDNIGWTPLHVTVFFQRYELKPTVEFLLERGSDVNALTDGGYSVLSLLEAGLNRSFVSYLENILPLNETTEQSPVDSSPEHADVLRLLLFRGAKIDHQDDILGWTPLHWAAAVGDLSSIEILVNRGANLRARAKTGHTPPEIAENFGMRKASEYFVQKMVQNST